jgi:hypothetical protein
MDTTLPPVPLTQDPEPTGDGGVNVVFCDEYTNRWGKRMIAKDYGYDKWCLRIKGRRRSGPNG